MKKKKIKKEVEQELKGKIFQLEREEASYVTVYRFTENLGGTGNLKVGDIIKHTRTAKVVSINYLGDKTEVVLERIKGVWEKVIV